MPLDAHTIIHRWFDEVWTQGREEIVDELCAPDAIGHGLGEGSADVHGLAEFRAFLRNMRSAFPDVHIRVEDSIANGAKAVVRVVLEGTHLGEGIGLAPTRRRVSVTGMVLIRVAEAKVAESWNNWDQLGLLRQLGAIPAPQASDRFLSGRE
jgi:steroid delta-isomerase-like uncharacterized protein